MKQCRRFLAAILAVLLCMSAVAALAAGTVTTTANVNLRKGAGLDYASIRTIGKGVKLSFDKTSVDERGVTWYRVSYKGKTGWVSSVYAQEGTASSGKVTTTATLNLRSGAGTEYEILRAIGAGTTLTYDRVAKDSHGTPWLRVSYKGKTGWISSQYVKAGGGSGSVSGKVTTTASVNLRSGAGLDYESLRIIGEGVTLTYNKMAKDERGVIWYRVSYKGTTGWVSAKYARSGGGGSSKSGKSVVGDTGKSNVHTGPGLDYKNLGVLHKGESAKFLNQTSIDDRGVMWYKISWNGRDAWVSSRYTKLK